MTRQKVKSTLVLPPKKERGLRKTGYTVAGYPFALFGIPTILHSKKVEVRTNALRETDLDCGGLMKPVKIWVNDVPDGYEVVIALQCLECKYIDDIRFPYSGHKQLFNSTSNRTWSLRGN
jgi:hypothetical protein